MATGRGKRVSRLSGPAGSVRCSAVVARRICRRLESGETLTSICQDTDMPHRSSVLLWKKELPVFAAAMEASRKAAGWHGLGGHPPVWNETAASMVCMRLAAGESLTRICEDPEMPTLGVVNKWRLTNREFATQLALARLAVADRFFDLGWEIACDVTPENAYATRVKLAQLRWRRSRGAGCGPCPSTASHGAGRRMATTSRGCSRRRDGARRRGWGGPPPSRRPRSTPGSSGRQGGWP